ncbi:MAG TPA: hypothetical protein VIS06_19610 [Mycobacteriales bacterium]
MRRGIEVAIWFVLLTGVYLVLVGPVTGPEVGVGTAVAATSAVLAVLARSAERLRDRPMIRWLTWLVPLPAAVLADTGRLAGLLFRRLTRRYPTGGTDGIKGFTQIQLGPSDAVHRPAQLALAMWVVSIAPGCYVVDADHERGVLTVHRISGASSGPEKRVGR